MTLFKHRLFPWLLGFGLGLLLPCLTLASPPKNQHTATAHKKAIQDKALQRWVTELKRPQEWARARALQKLADLSGFQDFAIFALLRSLDDPHREVRSRAVTLLSQQEGQTHLVVTALLRAYQDKSATVRWRIVEALGRFPQEVKRVVPLLQKAFSDRHPRIRAQAATALGWLGPIAHKATPTLLQHASTKDAALRRQVLFALGRVHQPKSKVDDIIKALRKGLQAQQSNLRAEAAQSLGRLGSQSFPALKDLRSLLNDRAPEVRQQAVWALGQMGPKAATHITDIYKKLEDPNPTVRSYTAITLGQMGTKALPLLRRALRSRRPETRKHAATALGEMGPKAQKIGYFLVKRLRDDEVEVRLAAVQALHRVQYKRAIWPLIRKLKDKSWEVREAVAQDIWKWKKLSRKAVPALAQLMYRDKRDEVLLAATRSMGRIRYARWAVTALYRKGLSSQDPDIRLAAAQALGDFQRKARRAVRPLLRTLYDSRIKVRRAVIAALGKIGSSRGVRKIAKLTRDANPQIALDALTTLGQLGHKAKRAVPSLLRTLQSQQDAEVREHTIQTLAKIGRSRDKVIVALQKALKDNSPRVRNAARQAIKQLRTLALANTTKR